MAIVSGQANVIVSSRSNVSGELVKILEQEFEFKKGHPTCSVEEGWLQPSRT